MKLVFSSLVAQWPLSGRGGYVASLKAYTGCIIGWCVLMSWTVVLHTARNALVISVTWSHVVLTMLIFLAIITVVARVTGMIQVVNGPNWTSDPRLRQCENSH